LQPDWRDEVVRAIAVAENITLTDDHWTMVNYLRDQYREHGHTPTSASCSRTWLRCCRLRQQAAIRAVSLRPANRRQAGRLPQPLGKGGY
jgi:tRNA 2-thiouridine synthesizing protein E